MQHVIIGQSAIASHFGKSRWTIKRWINDQNFPVTRLPDGTYCTTIGMIENWLRVRKKAMKPKTVKPK